MANGLPSWIDFGQSMEISNDLFYRKHPELVGKKLNASQQAELDADNEAAAHDYATDVANYDAESGYARHDLGGSDYDGGDYADDRDY